MSETLNILKNQRINEINNAANTNEEKITEVNIKKENNIKPNNTIRTIVYPTSIGIVGGLIGYTIAQKTNYCKKCLVIGGVILGASLGFVLLNLKTKKND